MRSPSLSSYTFRAPREWIHNLRQVALDQRIPAAEFVRQAVDEKMARLAAEKCEKTREAS